MSPSRQLLVARREGALDVVASMFADRRILRQWSDHFGVQSLYFRISAAQLIDDFEDRDQVEATFERNTVWDFPCRKVTLKSVFSPVITDDR